MVALPRARPFLCRASAGSVLMNWPTYLAILCQTFVGSCQDGAPYETGRLLGWLADRSFAVHVPVRDNSERENGTFSHSDFRWKVGRGGKAFTSAPTARFCTSAAACATAGRCSIALPIRLRCLCTQNAVLLQGAFTENPRDLHEYARDAARRLIRTTTFLSSRATGAGASRGVLPI
jgi:hypothetical protein